MIEQLNKDLFQTYSNPSDTTKIDIMYNNAKDFFYFETYRNGLLEQGDTRIVNGYENAFVKFSSLSADTASFDEVESFKIEVKDA